MFCLQYMIDLPLLLKHQPVVLTSQYLALHSLPPSLERGNGQWDWGQADGSSYHTADTSYRGLEAGNFEHDNNVPVDWLAGLQESRTETEPDLSARAHARSLLSSLSARDIPSELDSNLVWKLFQAYRDPERKDDEGKVIDLPSKTLDLRLLMPMLPAPILVALHKTVHETE